ncbi:MAG: RNA-directed DNA polymerase [Anaerolineae bacterium]|nr:RNA-directed DNA polymerase [Anaerolineae bacterium]
MSSIAAPTDVLPAALFSPEALRRAWRMVRKNGQSPGIDRITPRRFEQQLDRELRQLRAELIDGSYQPQPVQRYYQLKASGKKRPLTIWAVRDRVAQRAVLDYLTPVCEELFLECSYGFRPGRKIGDAVSAVVAARRRNLQWVVDADIAECFDSIPTRPLLRQVQALVAVPFLVRLIDGWLHTPVAGRPGICAGVSQGGVISPLLTNLYLHPFDEALVHRLPNTCLVRFADDFVILCRRKQAAAEALALARRILVGMQMRMNESKTRVVHFDEGFTFLGVQFKGSHHSGLPGSPLKQGG